MSSLKTSLLRALWICGFWKADGGVERKLRRWNTLGGQSSQKPSGSDRVGGLRFRLCNYTHTGTLLSSSFDGAGCVNVLVFVILV